MQISDELRGKYLIIKAYGKLDVTWADHFATTLRKHIHQGNHNILIDASEMIFLSSAGIRSLMTIYKELLNVNGTFQLFAPTEFVKKTLETSGLQIWLNNGLPADLPASPVDSDKKTFSTEVYVLNQNATLEISTPAKWRPWQQVKPEDIVLLDFPKTAFAIGIGSAAENANEARSLFGEFLAIAGNVVYQTPDENTRPDYLLSEGNFVPHLQTIQALYCNGEMSHLIRFSPENHGTVFPISEIAEMAIQYTQSSTVGFVILGEIDGLVGVNLIRSPGEIEVENSMQFPEIRDWLSFCGERLYAGQQALLFGVATRISQDSEVKYLSPSGQNQQLFLHVHAAVFPYQTLQNGQIELISSIAKFFNGPPPQALLHLVDDSRPSVGLGQSSLLRGACWCAPIKNQEVQL